MSLDGSFSSVSALRRLLARCPGLQADTRLVSLSQKGEALADDDVVNSIAEPFLHPKYTIPIIGCFRPLSREIVEKAVSLLQLVPDLTSEAGDVSEFEEGEARVIELCVERGMGLRLHEASCLAFCRTIDMAPFLLRYILSYFSFSPPPFQRLLTVVAASQLTDKDIRHTLDSVRVCLRLLLMESKIFSEHWDWSSFMDLVQQFANFDFGSNTMSSEKMLDIRWCGLQILSVVLKMSDRMINFFGLDVEEAFMCSLRWEEFCKDVSLEKAGWYVEAPDIEMGGSTISSSFQQSRLVGNYSEIKSSANPFVLTSMVQKSYEMALLAVNNKWPVLLYGATGAGKTALINKLADACGNRVLFIHMDEQMDSKTLIGSYISSDQPGEFSWQPGSLTQAVLMGLWIVFEDIDKAPSELHSILLPLLEGSTSFLTGRGEAITVSESFRLFATMSNVKHDFVHNQQGRISLGTLWRKVMVGCPGDKDLIDIINARYPSLESLSTKLVDTYRRVNSISSFHPRVQVCDSSSPGAFSRFSLRDLLKWCKRITGLSIGVFGFGLSYTASKQIYQEAVDIFAASSASFDNRLSIMREIAVLWEVPMSEVESVYPPNKPVIQSCRSGLQVGRILLQSNQTAAHLRVHNQTKPFVDIRSSIHVLERITCSVKYNEPVLLVGETGTGKTTLVQNLAMRICQPLTILNLSQQSDVSDLLGGYKPVDARSICIPLHHEFKELFLKTALAKVNEKFLIKCEEYAIGKKWKQLLSAFRIFVDHLLTRPQELGEPKCGIKRKRHLSEEVFHGWESFSVRLQAAHKQIHSSAHMTFSFVEGAFVTALRKGHWILLDEVNLAPGDTLQRIISVLDGENGTFCLAERGDINYIDRHPNFRLFACMNPATDAGKRDLPHSFRSRFTEYFVDDVLDDDDLTLFIKKYVDEDHVHREILNRIICFYKVAKRESEERLQDGANQRPRFSLRSLARALEYTGKAQKEFGFLRALYDGFSMFFLTLLDGPSTKLMNSMIVSSLLGGKMPPDVSFDRFLVDKAERKDLSNFDSFVESYVLTKSVRKHLMNLARAVFIKRYPVLLQGPTSSGKTSLIRYLAAITGHEFVRINNHEHTDLQEYFGTYITDAHGRLEFQEGALVKAVRKGYWIVLDELNLAPTDVLEALNRLLDDNRELFVPDLQEVVSAHPNFMLFATQNPPTLYGGRKMLSRAFRNRFLEIHVDDIPEDELSTILKNRCKIPESYALKMVEVMKDLQLHRQNSKVFAGKHGFITPRDLFRWGDRFRVYGNSYEDLAKDGYFLLAERLRDESEKNVVQEILERRFRVKLMKDELYMQESNILETMPELIKQSGMQESLGNIIFTQSMKRLYFLVERCYRMREPVLLVGETGGGKTTVCQLLSTFLHSKLHTLNCHQYTETSDFLGGFYPVRNRTRLAAEFRHKVENLKMSKAFCPFFRDLTFPSEIEEADLILDKLNEIANSCKQDVALRLNVTQEDLDGFEIVKSEMLQLQRNWQTIFLWHDGPLIQAMKDGDLFLVDEISLADDSVLERLNSVLEPERKLVLAEKGGAVLETVNAHADFFLLATMNPGGDYGKKELSPALQNRFTVIWVPPVNDTNELKIIAEGRFMNSELRSFAGLMLEFWEWFNQLQTGRILTVRDLLSWVDFINMTWKDLGSVCEAFIHGAFLLVLDGLTLGTGISRPEAGMLRERSLTFLVGQLKQTGDHSLDLTRLSKVEAFGWGGDLKHSDSFYDIHQDNCFGIHPFYIDKGNVACKQEGFEFLAPTTCRNALRLLRALKLPRPVLLEGSPGVGKTSLVVAIAKYSGHSIVRINLSEQTDMMDLLGTDLPVECENGMKFAWSDGILLQALKAGSWVLLDELNLAPQSVLEGLNAILDHRAEVYIPELGCTFKCPPSFKVFACQNPSCQGGGRKGLPKSFLNRFSKVYIEELGEDDYLFICRSLYPSIPSSLLSKLIHFNKRLYEDTMLLRKYGQEGSPWEFNLRDVIRSCQLLEGNLKKTSVDTFLSTIYLQRMRTMSDREKVLKLYEEIFGAKLPINNSPRIQICAKYLIVGNTHVERKFFQPSKILKSQLLMLPGIGHYMEAALNCVRHKWLCILVGPSSSGKTSMIRLLAQLTGNVLNELNLSSGTDVSELLGCFEQYNAFHTCNTVIGQVERYVGEYCSLRFEHSGKEFIKECKDLISRWLKFLASTNYSSSMSTSTFMEGWRGKCYNSLNPLMEIIEQLKLDLERHQLPVSWTCNDLNNALKTVLELQTNNKMQTVSAKFEWVTGVLIKAIECGEWIVLENANLCNPTVLDRINSLVEPSRTITVNECGLVDGKPVVLQAHPGFCMFLTVDPKYGEVSRAMRNRGVEIFMKHPCRLLYDEAGDPTEYEIHDVRRFLVLSGIPDCKLVDAMAKAHMYARGAGLSIGVHITLLELTRWVQLFQQLIMNGNRTSWSLLLSWEHTYLSSLGEAEGKDIIAHVKQSYLMEHEWYMDSHFGNSLSLPGGWPSPSNLRYFLWYPEDTCIKQNCLYLEWLGSQCASSDLSSKTTINFCLSDVGYIQPSMLPVQFVHHLLFPNASGLGLKSGRYAEFDLGQGNKMLFIAANWTMEQATRCDYARYILWFKWYSSRLHPYCDFFGSFLSILEREQNHPIWKCIHTCQKEIISRIGINVDSQPFPLLSLELLELTASNTTVDKWRKPLHNAIRCVVLLRFSLQQWDSEKHFDAVLKNSHDTTFKSMQNYDYNKETACLREFLRQLEWEVLEVIIESPHFEQLIHVIANILEYHKCFWECITSSQFDILPIVWNLLLKEATKLRPIFPDAVDKLLLENKNLCMRLSFFVCPLKPMLWIYGGHPFLPSSAEIHVKMEQLLNFCDEVWPMRHLQKQESSGNSSTIVAIVSTNSEIRQLALQGICVATCIASASGQDDSNNVHQLDHIYQMLLRRFEHEKHNLEGIFMDFGKSSKIVLVQRPSNFCCAFCPEILCEKPCFDSWLESVVLLDRKSLFLDMELLQELSESILVDAEKLNMVLSKISKLLEYNWRSSLNSSSRPPTDFCPHQNLLWMLDAWTLVDAVHEKVASHVVEIWYNWHHSLWACTESLKNYLPASYNQACYLLQSVRMTMVDKMLQDTVHIKDHATYRWKLRVASRSLWQDAPLGRDVHRVLHSMARSLFKQIIFAHRKSFQNVVFAQMKSILYSLNNSFVTEEELQKLMLKELCKSSDHDRFRSLMKSIADDLLEELYLAWPSHEYLYKLGCAWLHIGILRFHLLLNSDGPDPTMKYAFKHSMIQEKIHSIDLEVKVRQECEYLAGSNSRRDNQDHEKQLLEYSKEQQRLQSKIVYRPAPSKFKSLQDECCAFMEQATQCIDLAKGFGPKDIQSVINQCQNWQILSSNFFDRLAKEYAAYVDITKPIQLAVFELKLGLSLVESSALENACLKEMKEENTNRTLEIIYSLMQFPRGFLIECISDEVCSKGSDCFTYDSQSILAIDVDLLKKLVAKSYDNRLVSPRHVQATVYHIILIRLVHYLCCSLIMNRSSLMLLDEIFGHFGKLWMEMKSQKRTKENNESQYYRFRSREVKLEDVLKVNSSLLENFDPDESLSSEWEESLVEQELINVVSPNEPENLEEELDIIQESWKSVILVHNQIFGSSNLVELPGTSQISDEDKLCSFMESYRLGRQIMKGLPDLSFVALDENLMSEQLLCICVEYKKFFGLNKIPLHNIYTDSNVSVVSEMVQPLIVLQERVKCLLDEWPDHPGLQKILDITVNLLSLSLSTPPAKVLLGLQYLLGRSVMLEEYGSKFYLADQLRPIYVLVSILQKMELDCWPALLDRIQEQYEINAENLWFPLHSVLYRKISGDLNDDYTTTIQSLEEFIQTSNVGEFKRRLELLLAFHGQFKATVSLNTQSSCHVEGILKILYNISGYYVQLVPIILENIKAGRERIETDLRELFKFAQWQQPMFNYSSIETFRRFRQKFWKLINKFNDTLQQPINTETVLKWNKMPDLPEWKICNDKDVKSTPTLDHLSQFNPTERNSRFIDWRSKVESAYRGLCTEITSGGYFSHEPIHLFLKSISSGSALLVLQERWENGWDALETICRSATDCANLCKEQTSSLKKRRAISDLLKLLERCGLSKHGYILSEMDLMLKQQSGWFLQPSYDVGHLLLPKSSTSNHDVHHQKLVDNNCHTEWIEANAYYFKNLGMVQRIRQICLNFHKDLSLEQVNRINSFIDHLIRVQQGQRSAAYVFSEKLDKLRRLVSSLKGTGSDPDCSITLNQNATGKCMWKQKKILDCLYGMSRDLFLLLRTVGDSHLNDCNEVRIDVSSISIFIEEFTKKFLKSKESLDKYLLHNDAAMITTVVCTEPYRVLVSKNMEELIMQNFQIIEEFDKGIQAFVGQAFERSMKKHLLSCFDGIICQAKRLMEEFRETDCQSINICVETFAEADASFSRSFGTAKKLLLDSIKNIDMLSPDDASAEVLCPEKITSWNALLEFYMEKMQLDLIYDALSETIMAAGKLVNLSQDRRSEVCKRVELCFRDLCASLDMMLSLSDGLLIEFIALHKSVVKMAIMLAHLFSSLFSEGFGNMEEQTDDTQSGRSHDAAGTGIGEGEGVKDVSEQIDDEDQILGTFEKTDEGPDANDKLPSQDDKGIEMNEDFAADTFSVSEDSDDGNSEDGEDVNLDSAMGELGDSGKAIDEKLCDGDEDEDGDPNNGSEKYETGPSVKEKDVHSEEFRAKEDMSGIEDEAGELDNGEAGKVNENSDEPDISNENENVENMKMDKVNAFEEPTGLQPNEQNEGSEDASIDEHENMETMDDAGPETDEDMVEDDKISPEDDDEIPEQVDTKVESNGGEEENTENANMDIVENNRDRIEPKKSDPIGLRGGPGQSSDTMEPFNDPQSENASLQHEAHWSNSSEMQNILASSTGLPSDDLPNLQINLPNTGSGGKLTSDQPEVKSSEQDVPVQRPRANPYRSIGDALADWDDKIKVSTDSLEHKSEAVDEQEDEKGDEYKYVSTEEKSTSQALGPATSDQLNGNIKGDDLETDEGHNQQKDDQNQMDIEREDTPMQLTGSCMPSNFKQKTNDELQEMGGGIDASLNEVQEGEDQQMQLGDSVSIKNSYVNDSTVMLHNMVIDDQKMETVVNIEEISNDMKTDAMVRWKRYEQITTRLSQELSEQLRLVMEPTLANKLQGDYKTGKRINMKKVIPYIASHYRKDKIWLRRTRPNKRDYQVVIAIDDSRSMSESHCGEVAIEALVTVCRAMSQLEVGQFAVSSFGEGGNIQLLHDFDQPFNGEAGANMISRLTFRKENTIIDEPVVHLLKFLNDMLDGAVARSRLPSGQNPLQQLVLIIADGRFHEKEKLKRYVRDVLNRKRMIAFILLDSPQESIMELMEATFKDEGLSFSRYLDSFPFPYYIVLRNIEALPRTLADLLRQWFELMQSTSD